MSSPTGDFQMGSHPQAGTSWHALWRPVGGGALRGSQEYTESPNCHRISYHTLVASHASPSVIVIPIVVSDIMLICGANDVMPVKVHGCVLVMMAVFCGTRYWSAGTGTAGM